MKSLLIGLTALVAAAAPARAQDGPIQHFIMVEMQNGADVLALDRWYITHHAPETLARTGGAQTRYVSFRTYAVSPQEAAEWKMVTGRLTEIGFASVADFRRGVTPEALAANRPTPPDPSVADGWTTQTVTVRLPGDAVKAEPAPEKATPYARWVAFVRAPDAAPPAEADLWVRRDFAGGLAAAGSRQVTVYRPAIPRGYTHVVVALFDDPKAWRAGMAAFRAALKPGPWGGGLDSLGMRSILVGERPDLDFKTDRRVIP